MAELSEQAVAPMDTAAAGDRRPVPSSTAPAAAPADPLARFEPSLRAIDDGLRGLSAQFEQRLAIDAVKDAQIKQLHAELLQHRQGLAAALVQPLLMAMIRLRDDIGRRVVALNGLPADQLGPGSAARELDSVQDDVMLALEAGGAVAYEEPAAAFNPARQQSVRTVPTDDPARHGTVALRVAQGYEFNGRILVKERVRVYVHEPAAAPPQPAAPEPAVSEPAESGPVVSGPAAPTV